MALGLNNAGASINDWFGTSSSAVPSGGMGSTPASGSGYTDQQLASLDNTSNSNGFLNDFSQMLGAATTGAATIMGASNPAKDQTPVNAVQQPPGANAAHAAAASGGLLANITPTEMIIGAGLIGLGIWAFA